MVKERFDHFLTSSNVVASFPFMETNMIRKSTSNRDAIVLDTKGRKPRDRIRDPRLSFRYDVCWAKEYETKKKYIKDVWQKGTTDIMGKIVKVGKDLGAWQYNRYKKIHNQIGALQVNTNKIFNSLGGTYKGNRLRAMRLKLGNLLDKVEKYWAQRSRVNWLKKGEVNGRLLQEFTDNEIKEAFSQIYPRKSLGIDGLSGNFYKENWDVVGNDIINLCHEVFRGARNVDSLKSQWI
ncbi:hypothetical protein PVK06_027171 [Gossypium arboreum]|uniref:Reverse transcriptase n=1 Tax=Gossypium arboreum TaxID=29729 RepID=A0ABR0NZL1_GOSAR|nr:hypothetical protein PVK06_027171 [Gossypium arboreum]